MRSNLLCECLFFLPKHFLVDSSRLHISVLNYVTAYDAEFSRFTSVKESVCLHLFLVTLTSSGERVEREVGGGIRMGNTCKPMAVSFQCMTKFTTNKKK